MNQCDRLCKALKKLALIISPDLDLDDVEPYFQKPMKEALDAIKEYQDAKKGGK